MGATFVEEVAGWRCAVSLVDVGRAFAIVIVFDSVWGAGRDVAAVGLATTVDFIPGAFAAPGAFATGAFATAGGGLTAVAEGLMVATGLDSSNLSCRSRPVRDRFATAGNGSAFNFSLVALASVTFLAVRAGNAVNGV